jgi:predicted flap endonuclease-1-like 5' DNA nuclease
MYLINQIFIFLALALIVGGAIGYALRACMADTACDDLRDELALVQSRQNAQLESQTAVQTRQVTPAIGGVSAVSGLADMNARDFEDALLVAAPGTLLKNRFGADDLTAIRGVTRKMDVWLGLNGITRFSHIADLTAGELYWLVENLPQDGASVYRDHWVAQASKLVAGQTRT